MSEKITKLVVNLRGWYIKGLGALERGFVFDMKDKTLSDVHKARAMEAYNGNEMGFCRDQKEIVPVVVKKISEEDILENLTEKFAEMVGDKISIEDIEEFKNDLKAGVGASGIKTATSKKKKNRVEETSLDEVEDVVEDEEPDGEEEDTVEDVVEDEESDEEEEKKSKKKKKKKKKKVE